jgi:hypothetical protein
MGIALVTFCHPPRYAERLHQPGMLRTLVESHGWPFDDVVVIHNQCQAASCQPFDYPCRTVDLPRREFDDLMLRWDVDPYDERFHELTHGEGAPHWYPVHVVNHLCGLENTDTEFIVFADCDTRIKSQPSSWVGVGISILRNKPEVLIVSPGDGGQGGGPAEGGRWPDGTRLTRNVSQQLFLCRADEFRDEVDFDVPWDGEFNAPYGPFGEFYALLEGRLWRYMDVSGQWRAILPDEWRYWHNSFWATDREAEGW